MRIGTRGLAAAAAIGLALGNLGRVPGISIGGRGGAISLLDLTLIPLWLLLLVTLGRGTRRWRLDAFSLAGLAFVSVAALSTVLAGPKWQLGLGEHAGVAAFLLRWVLYAGWYLLIVTDPEPDDAGRAAWGMMEKAVVAVLLFGFFQSAFLPNFAMLTEGITGLTFDYQGRRLVSTMLDPHFAGGLLMILLLMRVALEAEGIRTNRWLLLGLVLGLLLTLSRASWLALLPALLVIAAAHRFRGPLMRLGLVGGAVTLALLPGLLWFGGQFNKFEVDGSALMRFIPWLRAGILVRDNPVLGVGFNAAGPAQRAYGWETFGGASVSMDGGLLFIAVMTGLLGLTAFVWMLWAFFAAARRSWRSPSVPAERRAFALGGWAAMVAILVHSMFGNDLLIPWLMLPLWIVQGRVLATAPRAVPAAGLRSLGIVPAAGLRAPVMLLVLAGLPFLAACDPCAGVAGCRVEAQRGLTGTIVRAEGQTPRAGVAVFVGTLYTETDAAGRWVLNIPGATDTTVTVTVAAPGEPPYEIANVAVRSSRVAGEAQELGLWYDRPVVNYVAGVARGSTLIPGVNVRFTTDSALGGHVYEGSAPGGYFWLKGLADVVGPVRGTLRLQGGGLGTRNYPDVTILADHKVEPERIRGTFQVDVKAAYGGNVIHRGNGTTTPGATVRFTRTGGVPLVTSPVTTTTVSNGFFVIELEYQGKGETIGTLTITPPTGTAYTYPDFRFSTYDSTAIRYIGLVAHGHRWEYLARVARESDSTAIAWTPFTFTRTSGLAITPNTFNGMTNGQGEFFIKASVSGTGSVTGTVTFNPVGQPSFSGGSYTLSTYAGDVPPLLPVRYVAVP
ncbi:MAG: O-antigen ligase family protein [Gemmatimonadaceae bacterium]|nr:O-antigen ligase family protein [Gemmatimonadaceae bacterium]MCW5825400.1 O-antigen ligase family protein [Gemmatimonadaceae bacterium]